MFHKFSLTRSESDTFKVHKGITSIADIVDHQLATYGERIAIRVDCGTSYNSISFKQYLTHITSFIRFLNKVKAEQKVIATLCKNRLEWDMVAMGTFYTGNILFPLDSKFNATELEHLIKLGVPDFILVSSAQLERVRAIKDKFKLLSVILVADLMNVYEDIGFEKPVLQESELSISDIYSAHSDNSVVRSNELLKNKDIILGHYATSGTVSLPKIVRISHKNIIAEVNCAIDVMNLRPNEDVLNIGPYTHIATLVEFLVSKTRGFTVTYFTREPDDDDVLEDEIEKLKDQKVRIKALMAVPKFWIYLMKEVLEEMKNKPVLKNLYEHLISIENNGSLHDISTIDKAKLTAMRILLRNKLGGYFSYGISSSMKLDGAIVRIFGKLGVTVIDIYGATECCGIISRNKLNDIYPGSCGKLIPELTYSIEKPRAVKGLNCEAGVLLVKGPTVAKEYFTETGRQQIQNDPDGFYVTGDLCYVTEDRQVFLVGREKELMLWEDGSYIDPQYLSNLLVRSIFVKDAMVVRVQPEDRFLSVFIYPDYKRLEKDPEFKKEIATGVSRDDCLKQRCINAIKYAESIAKIAPPLNKNSLYILSRKLERTPTHKIKFMFEMANIHQARVI